jgi:hypothetical protein
MKSVACAWAGAILILAAAIPDSRAEIPGGALRKPKAFPDVGLVTNASLQYGTVALDTWTGKVAYLLVDGSASNGYSRLFAWIPNDTRFGKPVEWKPKASEATPGLFVFGDLENKDAQGDEKVSVLWRFSTYKESRAAGGDTYFDYVTGKSVARSWAASSWHRLRFAFNLGYACGKAPSGSMDGSYPLELTLGDDLPLYQKWEQVPEPGDAPFRAVMRARHEVQETRDPRKGRLLCLFDGFDGAIIKKAPGDVSVGLVVVPYMGEPVVSNSLTMAEFMKSGFDQDIPYGWYSLRLTGFQYGRFTFGGRFHQLNIDPVPISRPMSGN